MAGVRLKKTAVEDDIRLLDLPSLVDQFMCGICSQNHKVLGPIVRFVFIDVMDYFGWVKESAQHLFRNESMFIDKAPFIGIGMRSQGGYGNIAPRVIFATALPERALFFSGLLCPLKGLADLSFMLSRKLFPSMGGAHFGLNLIGKRATFQSFIPGWLSHVRKAYFLLRFFWKNITLLTAMIGDHSRYRFSRMMKTFLHHFNIPCGLIISQFTYVSQLFTLGVSHGR